MLKKIFICIFAVVLFLTSCTPLNTESNDTPKAEKEYENLATVGVWLSYSEINAMLKSENGFKAEIDTLIKNCKALKIGEIYVHIRAFCDSLFKSEIFPLTANAKELDFDAFEFILNECHANNIKVQAWINPYRVLTSSDDIEALDKESPAYKWLKDETAENDINVIKYNGIYLNPASAEVQGLVINGIREVLNNYKVDGIHFDDYFYPTEDPAFDQKSYSAYKSQTENPLELADWRRANVNALISGCYNAVKFYDKNIDFTISPAADIDKNYSGLYADIEAWVKNGYVDAIIPQLYFGFEYPSYEFCFEYLLNRWEKLLSVNKSVKLIIGLAPYKIGTDSEHDKAEWSSEDDIIARQAEICYKNKNVSGYVLFSYSSLVSQNELNVKQRDALMDFVISCK